VLRTVDDEVWLGGKRRSLSRSEGHGHGRGTTEVTANCLSRLKYGDQLLLTHDKLLIDPDTFPSIYSHTLIHITARGTKLNGETYSAQSPRNERRGNGHFIVLTI